MFVELHLLQNFAPSNLNRDDTGSPKDCVFGGHRRGRISSQCLKRSIRTEFKEGQLLPADDLAMRTKRLVTDVAQRLAHQGRELAVAQGVVENALGGLGLTVADKNDADRKTQYLLFLGNREIQRLTEICGEHWDALAVPVEAEDAGKKAKKAAKAGIPKNVADALKSALDGGKASDLALFGRMLADIPDRNVDAGCQVAHALSTNRVQPEFDFYTAVDDLKPSDNSGADMIGTIEFNSACFYRYANIDLNQLAENLGGDINLAATTVEAFWKASISAIPTGKQNSMAAQNPPSFVFAVARERGLWSLANAFAKPVAPTRERDLVEGSIEALDAYWGGLTRMYGSEGIRGAWVTSLHDDNLLAHLKSNMVESVPLLIDNVVEEASAMLRTAG